MFYGAKGNKIKIGDTDMDYVTFGRGEKKFVILPGLSDGLKTVKGQAFTLARYYKMFEKEFKVYIFSRKNHLNEGYTTREMARDQKIAMEKLNLQDVFVMGISQGGMISQYLAIDYPHMVKKLIIGVSASRKNETVQNCINRWILMARYNDYRSLITDTMEKTFTEKHLKKFRLFFPIISRIGKPKSFDRFINQAYACLGHHAYDELDRIKCPTLVIGGDHDQVVGKGTSEEMGRKIKGSKLVVYKGLGHGAYEETKDFNMQVMAFL
ncbi:MAG: alpha/beta hydrolase [Clostridia bacterium]|nr:alpha/beta hydrolase [Clostridia bacterium]